MDARDADFKKELDATLQAGRDLGAEYESAFVDSFLEKIEQRVDSAVDRRVRRQLAEQQMVVARGASGPSGTSGPDTWGDRFGFAMVTLILAIPLSAIGVVNAGLPGLIVTWAGIVGVNAVHSTWPWRLRGREEKTATDWEA
ncbi:hypothetical protein [Streptomyces uncialis]|uniref:hypothetical protein n=1 Tax=Streptomyces uncialis TaxID=1048205 RepID=UPI00386FBB59|nr:hypothetical protein OG268_15070 [Streptomyces uncialis]